MMNQLSSRVYQNALIDLKDAFSRYRSGKAGHPKFASRRNGQSLQNNLYLNQATGSDKLA